MKKIVATLNIGNCAVHDNARRSMRAAAARWGADYLEILYATGAEPHPYYQKLRLADHFPDGVRVLYLDGDIVVRCDCPSPFEIVPVGHFGACRSHHPSHAGATWHLYQPLQDYCRATGVALDPKEDYVHAGVLLFEFPTHRSLFAEIHDTLLMQFPFASQWPISDQAPISTAIKKLDMPTFWLPPMFQMSGDVLWWGWTAEMQYPVLHFCGPIDRLECIGRTSWDNLGADRRVSGTDVIRWSAGKPKALLNEPELPMLIREMSRVRFGVIVELGSWLGGSAWWGAQCARDNYSDYYCVDKSAQIWSIERTPEPIKISHAASVWSVAWSRDGKSICTATVDGDVFIRDAQTGSPLGDKLESGQRVAFPTVRFLPDGDRLLVVGRLGPLQFWNRKTHKSLVAKAGGQPGWSGMIFIAAVSPDGRLFALGRGSGMIELFETASLKKVHAFEGHWGSIQDLAFAPNSPTLVSASRDHTLKFWNARRWTETTAPAADEP